MIDTIRIITESNMYILLLFNVLFILYLCCLLLFYFSKHGIPAMTDVVAFFFSGPRLYPQLRWPLIGIAPLLVTLLATLSSIYSARYAAFVQPAEAMQEKE